MRRLSSPALTFGIVACTALAACSGDGFNSAADGGTSGGKGGGGASDAATNTGGASGDGAGTTGAGGAASSGGMRADGGTSAGNGGMHSGAGGANTGATAGSGGATGGKPGSGGAKGGSGGVATGGQPEAGGSDAGASCASSSDCARNDICGFPTKDACAAKGTCFPAPGATCAAYSAGCACDGNTINVVCNGLPSGYATSPLAHAGACTLDANTFACGSALKCKTGSEYCEVSEGGVCCKPPSYGCVAVPAECASDATCACINAQMAGAQCTEANGAVTVTFQYP